MEVQLTWHWFSLVHAERTKKQPRGLQRRSVTWWRRSRRLWKKRVKNHQTWPCLWKTVRFKLEFNICVGIDKSHDWVIQLVFFRYKSTLYSRKCQQTSVWWNRDNLDTVSPEWFTEGCPRWRNHIRWVSGTSAPLQCMFLISFCFPKEWTKICFLQSTKDYSLLLLESRRQQLFKVVLKQLSLLIQWVRCFRILRFSKPCRWDLLY